MILPEKRGELLEIPVRLQESPWNRGGFPTFPGVPIYMSTRIVLSFDDGRKDNYDVAFPLLKKYGLTSTFNIATAYVDGTISLSETPCPNEPLSIDNIIEMSEAGFEIACHGDCHRNAMEDIERGLKKLRLWLGWKDNYKPGFASPRSDLSSDDIKLEVEKYKKIFSYMRIASYTAKESFVKRIIRKIAHLSHSKLLYIVGFADNMGGIRDGFIAVSIPIMNEATVDQIRAVIKRAVKNGQDVILMLHSIVPYSSPYVDDRWSWNAEKFEDLCKWLRDEKIKGMLEVTRTIDLL